MSLQANRHQSFLAQHLHGQLYEVTHHGLDVASHVADLGELRSFHLDKRRLRQAGEPPSDLGLADAGRSDHEDVLRRHLLRQFRRELLAPHPIPQRDSHRPFRLRLRDDVSVELGHDLTWRQGFDRRLGSAGREGPERVGRLRKINGHRGWQKADSVRKAGRWAGHDYNASIVTLAFV